MSGEKFLHDLKSAAFNALVLKPEDVSANVVHIEIAKHVSATGQILRWAVLTTRNGHVVTGKPVIFASALHDKPDVGPKIAVQNATDELWNLMVYALRERLAAGGAA